MSELQMCFHFLPVSFFSDETLPPQIFMQMKQIEEILLRQL